MASVDITLSSDVTTWQSLNTLAAAASTAAGHTETYSTGTALVIQNKGSAWFILQSTTSAPDADDTSGTYITSLFQGAGVTSTDSGENEYFVRPANYGDNCRINVQEV